MENNNWFIRKNTLELRQKLEDLGYEVSKIFGADPEDSSLIVDDDYTYWTWDVFPDYESHNSIDCGMNEDLFLALAALREDSDYLQWFVLPMCQPKNPSHTSGTTLYDLGEDILGESWYLHPSRDMGVTNRINQLKASGENPKIFPPQSNTSRVNQTF